MLTPTEYAMVSDTAYTIPAYPGPFTLQCNDGPAQAICRREVHHDRIHKFWETLDIKKALTRQVVAVIINQYLDELWDKTTNIITIMIPEILTYLFDNSADVTYHDMTKKKKKMNNYFWNLSDPTT